MVHLENMSQSLLLSVSPPASSLGVSPNLSMAPHLSSLSDISQLFPEPKEMEDEEPG